VLINKYRSLTKVKTRRVSFMPHWGSLGRGQWQLACELAGIHFVDPQWPVEEVVDAIESSDMVIAEAMHFAIVSDALRVPWVPVLPFHRSHWMKWHDWAEPLGINLKHRALFPSTLREASVAVMRRGDGAFIENVTGVLKSGVKLADKGFVRLAAARLSRLAKAEPILSSDTMLAGALEKLEDNAARIRRDYANC